MEYKYKTDKIRVYRLEDSSKTEVYLNENEKIHGKVIKNILNNISTVRFGDTISSIQATNCKMVFPLIPAKSDAGATYVDYIYAAKLNNTTLDVIKDGVNSDELNLCVLTNEFNMKQNNDDDYNDPSHMVIPFYTTSLGNQNRIYINYDSTMSGSTIDKFKNAVTSYKDTGHYFIVTDKRNYQFLLKGAASFINVKKVIENKDIHFYSRYSETSSNRIQEFAHLTGVNLLVVEVIFNGNETDASL